MLFWWNLKDSCPGMDPPKQAKLELWSVTYPNITPTQNGRSISKYMATSSSLMSLENDVKFVIIFKTVRPTKNFIKWKVIFWPYSCGRATSHSSRAPFWGLRTSLGISTPTYSKSYSIVIYNDYLLFFKNLLSYFIFSIRHFLREKTQLFSTARYMSWLPSRQFSASLLKNQALH